MENQEIIIYRTDDGKTSVSLMTKDGSVWLNQNSLSELFDTSIPNISMHISNILKENELDINSVIKNYLTTALDGKNYNVTFYSLDMILAIGFRVRSKRGTQFRRNFPRRREEVSTPQPPPAGEMVCAVPPVGEMACAVPPAGEMVCPNSPEVKGWKFPPLAGCHKRFPPLAGVRGWTKKSNILNHEH